MIYFILYYLLGCIWQLWLEDFTMKNLTGKLAQPMKVGETIMHVILWPVMLSIFLYNFFKTLDE